SEMNHPRDQHGDGQSSLLRLARERFGEGTDERAARSLRSTASAALWFEHGAAVDGAPRLMILAPHDDPVFSRFDGRLVDAGAGHKLLHGDTSAANAAALRAEFPNLRPVTLGLQTSAGFGDRLGLATPGHVAAMHEAGAAGKIAPIFAQQSIREMSRTSRSAQEVIDDATWGAFDAGW